VEKRVFKGLSTAGETTDKMAIQTVDNEKKRADQNIAGEEGCKEPLQASI